jgi:hypothetical protein
MTLEQEAEENIPKTIISKMGKVVWTTGFKAGANSKYVKRLVIEKQIEIIEKAESLLDLVSMHRSLNQQLKQLK